MADDPGFGPAELLPHAAAYHRFMLGVKWFGIHCAALIVLFVLWFATPAGFGAGLIAGLVVFGLGAYAMSHGMARSSEVGDLPQTPPPEPRVAEGEGPHPSSA
jgi:hypothetical protein